MIALALPAQDSGTFTPPGIEEMHLPAILPWGAADGFSKQMLLVILSVVIIATFFRDRCAEAAAGSRQAAVRRRGRLRLRPQRHRQGHHRRQRLHEVRPAAVQPVLLHPGEQHLRRHSADPASDLLARRRRLRAGRDRVHHLDRHRRQEERPEVLQAGHRSVRSSGATFSRSSFRSRSSPTSWSARSRTASVCSPPCWPAT